MTIQRIRPGLWFALLCALTLTGCGAGVLPPIRSEQERISVARDLANRGQCVNAVELLKSYIATNTGSADVDEAVYLLGLCHLKTKDWVLAVVEFERLLRDYPESDSAGSASFRLGEAFYGQARPPDFDQEFTNKALTQWQRYLDVFPGHWLNAEGERMVAQARHRLATKLIDTGELYLQLDLPGPARVYYEKVRDEYADTALLGNALIGLAQCDAREGKLDQAIETLRALEAQFEGLPIAEHARRERERLERRQG